jgi:DNA-binding NarL/FixJ family response regulator
LALSVVKESRTMMVTRPISVLAVDDNPRFLAILTRFLRTRHPDEVIVVGVAKGGFEALTQADALQPQMVILDLAMPDMPGWEVIPRLRKAHPKIGIIVLTLLDPSGYRERTLKAGADEFVAKSVLGAELLPAIRRVSQRDRRPRASGNAAPVRS